MRTSLVSIPTDTIPLDGAWYEPEGAATGAVLLFHGNTMNFYVGAPRFLPPASIENQGAGAARPGPTTERSLTRPGR